MHWKRKWQPTPVFLPGEPQGWRSLVGCSLWVAQSRTRLMRLSSSSSSSHTLATVQFLKFFNTFMLQILLVFSSGIFFCCSLPSHVLMTQSLLHPSGFYSQDSFSIRSSLAALPKPTTPTPKPTHTIPLLSLLFPKYLSVSNRLYLFYLLFISV